MLKKKHPTCRGIVINWALTEVSGSDFAFGQPWKRFKICNTFPVNLLAEHCFLQPLLSLPWPFQHVLKLRVCLSSWIVAHLAEGTLHLTLLLSYPGGREGAPSSALRLLAPCALFLSALLLPLFFSAQDAEAKKAGLTAPNKTAFHSCNELYQFTEVALTLEEVGATGSSCCLPQSNFSWDSLQHKEMLSEHFLQED